MEKDLLQETIDVLTSFIVYLNRKKFDTFSNDEEMLYLKKHYIKLCAEQDKELETSKLRENHTILNKK